MNQEFQLLKFKRKILNGKRESVDVLFTELQFMMGNNPFADKIYDGSNTKWWELDEITQWEILTIPKFNTAPPKLILGYDPVNNNEAKSALIYTRSDKHNCLYQQRTEDEDAFHEEMMKMSKFYGIPSYFENKDNLQ